MTPSRAHSLLQPVVLTLVALFIIGNLYGYFTREEEDDDDTVTITFNCTHVIANQNNFPEFVVQQCRQLRMR